MPLLGIPTAIADEYNAAIDNLYANDNLDKISDNQPEYDRLCDRLIALEVVTVAGFLKADNKEDYLKEIDERLEKFYLDASGVRVSCYPLQVCGNRCCFGGYTETEENLEALAQPS